MPDTPAPPHPQPVMTGLQAAASEQGEATRAGQRGINKLWEWTQSLVTGIVTVAMVYSELTGVKSEFLRIMFATVAATYYTRTNHTRIGGVPADQPGR